MKKIMKRVTSDRAAERLAEVAHPLQGVPADHDPLMELIGNARIVLLGEATHGTREFYRTRAEITQRLILEKGFTAVARKRIGRTPIG